VYLGEGTSFTYEGKTRVIWCSAIGACRADRGEILAAFCRDSHLGVVLQVGSNTREVHDDRNVELLKVGFWANTREHEDLRAVECPAGNNDLLSSKDLLLYPWVACEIVSWISAVHAFSGKVLDSDSPGEDKLRIFSRVLDLGIQSTYLGTAPVALKRILVANECRLTVKFGYFLEPSELVAFQTSITSVRAETRLPLGVL
jgi:hypothetical protein